MAACGGARLDGRQRGGVPLLQRAEGTELKQRAAGFVGEAQPAAGKELLWQRPGTQVGFDLIHLRVAYEIRRVIRPLIGDSL